MRPWVALATALLLVLSGAATSGTRPVPSLSSVGSGVAAAARPLNTSFAPCSLTNYTWIDLFLVGGPNATWTSGQLANLTHYVRIVSGAWNETCVTPEFQAVIVAHVREPQNFSMTAAESGTYTAQANLSVDFVVSWDEVVGTESIAIWDCNGATGAVQGPIFGAYPVIDNGPEPQRTAPTPGTSLGEVIAAGLGAGMAVGVAVGVVLHLRRRGRTPPHETPESPTPPAT